MARTSVAVYSITAAALLLLTAAAAVLLLLATLCLARRRGDPTRSWIATFRLAFGLYALALILVFFKYALSVVYEKLYDASFQAGATSVASNLLRAHVETGILGAFWDECAVIVLLLTLASLARGIGVARGAAAEAVLAKALRLGSYAFAALLGLLNLVSFALSETRFAAVYAQDDIVRQRTHAPETLWPALRPDGVVTFVMLVLQLVLALVLVRSVLVAVQAGSEPATKTPAHHLIACSTLMALRTSYDVGFNAKYAPPRDNELAQPPMIIVDVVLHFWSILSLLVLLLVLASKKQHGLWSTERPLSAVPAGHDEQAFLRTPWGYSHSPPSQQPLPPTWQWRQQQQQQQQQMQQGPAYDGFVGHVTLHGSAAPAPHLHELPMQPASQGAVPPRHPHPYAATVQASRYPSPPPPAHSEALGLYHQADGVPPSARPLSYNDKT